MQKIIQIHPCLLKLSRKQESVTDRQTDSRYYYIPHCYRGGIKKDAKLRNNMGIQWKVSKLLIVLKSYLNVNVV